MPLPVIIPVIVKAVAPIVATVVVQKVREWAVEEIKGASRSEPKPSKSKAITAKRRGR
ncbi:MAG: hypothetical protein ISN28_08105 [Ectothiorhodospiraceae bacterium AqS1]|nr:hypothetical protein [Ectothiorhodospiraceae bacterium AqS1]